MYLRALQQYSEHSNHMSIQEVLPSLFFLIIGWAFILCLYTASFVGLSTGADNSVVIVVPESVPFILHKLIWFERCFTGIELDVIELSW
jgi:hypothetical protein